MTLTMYQGDSGRTMYKLDGKRINAEKAEEIVLGNSGIEIVDETKCASHSDFFSVVNSTLESINSTLEAVAYTCEEKIFYRAVSDALTAIKEVEMYLPEFVINHNVVVEGGIFASNKDGDTMKLYDDRLEVFKKSDGTTMVYTFDIAESRFIKELKKVGNAETFEINGDSGTVYTFSKCYELLARTIDEPVTTGETLSHYVYSRRKSANKARAA